MTKRSVGMAAVVVACLAASAFSATASAIGTNLNLTGAGIALDVGDPNFVAINGVFVPGVNTADGRTTSSFVCYGSSVSSAALVPTASVEFSAVDGCTLQWRAAGSTGSAGWSTVKVAPGRTLPGAVTVTADVPNTLAGQFRVCVQAIAHFTNGTNYTSHRSCSDGSGGRETVFLTA